MIRRPLIIALFVSVSARVHGQTTRPGIGAPIATTPTASSAKSSEQTIADNFNSGKPELYAQAIALLDDVVNGSARKVRREMQSRWLKPMLRAKVYDQVERIAVPGILSGPEDTAGVSGVQNARVQAFLAAGKYDEALEAAKAYYNVCQLEETETAINFLVDALANSRGRSDPEIVRRFKLQQTVWADPAAKPSPSGDLSENVLKSIKVDLSAYEADIKALREGRVDVQTLTALGNLLLLADRPDEARKAFEQAVKLTSGELLTVSVANVARAICAQSGTVGQANAYILALRQPG